jgi:SNF2 family DNA or RNA helicase
MWGLDTELVEVAPERKVYVTKTWATKAISAFTAPFMGVVPLSEIAAELPEVSYVTIKVPKPRRFDLVLRGAATEAGRAKALAQARQLSDGFFYDDAGGGVDVGTEKLDALSDLLCNAEQEPVVIFAAWDQSVRRIAERFKQNNPAVLSGGTDCAGALREFTEGRTNLLVASSRIATGMNLQRARLMVFMSNSTSPVDRIQAEGRIVRPGQASKGVVIYDLVAEGTLDERHLELLKAHRDESEGFVLAALAREFDRRAKECCHD